MTSTRADLSTAFASLSAAIVVSIGTCGSHAQALQAECDGIADRVRAADAPRQPGHGNGQGFRVVDVSPDVQDLAVRHARLRDATFMDITIDVRASAQTGTLYLSAADHAINLGPGSSFTIAIGGALGVGELTFSSGTHLAGIAAAINSIRQITGVAAHVSGTGIRVGAMVAGSDRFVTVQIIDDGTIQGSSTGVYSMIDDDATAADPHTRVPFWYPWPVADAGQDVAATLSGIEVPGRGAQLRPRLNWLNADILLRLGPAIGPANAQTLGTFTACP
jgi:hypothetical protein